MQDDLIRKIAKLMAEQTDAYTSLESLTAHLIAAMTRCEPSNIDSLTRAGETELFRMRSRLLEITSLLTGFAEFKAAQADHIPLDADSRNSFEASANELLEAARRFDTTAGRATSLALGGSSFAAANLQMCGVPPTTYNAPVLKYSKGATS